MLLSSISTRFVPSRNGKIVMCMEGELIFFDDILIYGNKTEHVNRLK